MLLQVGTKFVLGSNQYQVVSVFSHHIGNTLAYEIKPTILNNKNELKAFTQVDTKLWLDSKILKSHIEQKQIVFVEENQTAQKQGA